MIIGERAGIGLALSRAEFLSRNNRWAILAAIIGFVFVNAVAGFTNNFLAQSIAAAAGGGDSIAAIIFGRLVTAVFTTLVVMIRSAGVATVYHELRTLKEGPASRTLAEIFD